MGDSKLAFLILNLTDFLLNIVIYFISINIGRSNIIFIFIFGIMICFCGGVLFFFGGGGVFVMLFFVVIYL